VPEDRAVGAPGRSTNRGPLRQRLSRWSPVAAAVALAAGLAGCGAGASAAPEETGPEATGALAVVVGAHSNMPPAALEGRSASAVDMALRQQSMFSMVVADGAPFDATASAEQVDRQVIDEAIAGARAQVAESDLLGAIGRAAEGLVGEPGLRTLVVLDSGLSTAGPLTFTTPGMLDAQPLEVADALRNAQQLPDLSGVRVVFHGLGDTAAPQQPLDPIRRAQLVNIWSAVVRTAGAASIQVEGTPRTGEPVAGLPPVSTIETGLGYRCEGTTMTLTGGPFAYRPDTAEFLDPAATLNALRPVAEQLRAGRIDSVLFGTTAAVGSPVDQIRFSDERAQAVADLLIELQVPIPLLHVEGRGSNFPGYVTDWDAVGHLLPAAAALNRTVRIEFSAPVVCG
jgi:hypothetical protein